MGQHEIPTAYENQLVALGRVLQTLREEENSDVLIETTKDYLQAEFNYALIWIGLYDRLDHRLFGKGGVTPTGDTKFLKQRFVLTPGDLLEQVVIQQRPVGIPDLREEVRAGEWRRAAQQFGIQGTLLFPLRCKDRCFGVVLLGSQTWGVSTRPREKTQLSLLFGGLAAALYQIEVDWQRSSTKRADLPLFQILDQMAGLSSMQQRLEALVRMTQEFIGPSRTSVYWYAAERRYFWHRVGNQQTSRGLGNLRTTAPGITVQEVSDFYQALTEGRLVAIGAGRSPLKAEVTSRLLSGLRAKSVLAAPIRVQEELVGFLAVEGSEPRIWEEPEKNYIRATAQLIAMVAGSEEVEAMVERTQKNVRLTAEVAKALGNHTDPVQALDACAQLVLQHLDAERLLILQKGEQASWSIGQAFREGHPTLVLSGNQQLLKDKEQTNQETYAIIYQRQPLNRRPLTMPLDKLVGADQQLLEQGARGGSSDEVSVVIEDWEESRQLSQWRETLMPLGVRSLLVYRIPLVGKGLITKSTPAMAHLTEEAHTSTNQLPESVLLLIGHNTPRTWNQAECQVARVISQQIGLLLHSLSLSNLIEHQVAARLQMQAGLTTLFSHTGDLAQLERAWVQFLAKMMECPLATLLIWSAETSPTRSVNLRAQVAATVSTASRFALPPDLSIPIATDALIQEALATEGPLEKRLEDLPASSRQWLSSLGVAQLLVMALPINKAEVKGLKTPVEASPGSQSPLLSSEGGLILLADDRGREWPSHLLPVVGTLVQQFTQIRQYVKVCESLQREYGNLEQLNWYKHRCLETLHQDANEAINRLQELESQSSPIQLDRSLARMRSSQLLHQLRNTLTTLTPPLNEEQWQLSYRLTYMPLTNLLKRSLRRVEPLYSQRQLVVRSHGISGNHHIYGDRIKLECVLFELLMMTGSRAPAGSRVHLSCQEVRGNGLEIRGLEDGESSPLTPLLELLITDSAAAATGLTETLDFSVLVAPKLPHLKICQQMLRAFGGDLQFYRREEDRYLIRLLLRTEG